MQMPRGRLPATVFALGLTSLLTDVSSEMIFPLLPVFLTGTLGAGPRFLGIVEGAADTVSSLLKLVAGRWADRMRRRKPLVLAGYAIAGAVRPLVAIATAPWHVLAVRVTDRIGKGIRTSPRDALIADAAGPDAAGRAFGVHTAMDHAGAVLGPLVASALLAAGIGIRSVFWIAVVPALAAFVVLLGVREPARTVVELPATPSPAPPLSSKLRAYLAILLVFSIANSSDAFLLLRARELGVREALLPALWAVFNLSRAVSAWWGGAIADRVPRASAIVAGWVVFAAVYLAFGVATSAAVVWPLFIVYGAYYGLAEPAEKALVRDLAPVGGRGHAYGVYNFVLGLAALPSSLLTGFMWRWVGPRLTLVGAAVVALGSAAALLALSRRVVLEQEG